MSDSWLGILRYPRIHRLKIARFYLMMAPRRLLRKLSLLGAARFRGRWILGLAWLLKNWQQAEVEALFTWLANDYLLDAYREDVIRFLEKHKAEGTKTVLISTIFEGAGQKIAERLGADDAIGTKLEFRAGIATGGINGKVCVGLRKLDCMRTYLQESAPEINLKDCIVYADSYGDAPMLAAAGMGMAVYPDKDLREAALEQSWEIHEYPPVRK